MINVSAVAQQVMVILCLFKRRRICKTTPSQHVTGTHTWHMTFSIHPILCCPLLPSPHGERSCHVCRTEVHTHSCCLGHAKCALLKKKKDVRWWKFAQSQHWRYQHFWNSKSRFGCHSGCHKHLNAIRCLRDSASPHQFHKVLQQWKCAEPVQVLQVQLSTNASKTNGRGLA